MKTQRCFAVLGDNKIIFRTDDSHIPKECRFSGIRNLPNIPFHLNLWEGDNARVLKDFLKEKVFETNALKNRFFSRKLFGAVPDDTQTIELVALSEFLMQTSIIKTSAFAYECKLMNPNELSYVCISRTVRMFVLSYIKDGDIIAQDFLDKMDYDMEELKRHVRNLHQDFSVSMPSIYLNGPNLKKYRSLGTIITGENILENFMQCPNIALEAPGVR